MFDVDISYLAIYSCSASSVALFINGLYEEFSSVTVRSNEDEKVDKGIISIFNLLSLYTDAYSMIL